MITVANRAPLPVPPRALTLEQRKNAMTNEGDPILSRDMESTIAAADSAVGAPRRTLSLPQTRPAEKN